MSDILESKNLYSIEKEPLDPLDFTKKNIYKIGDGYKDIYEVEYFKD